MLRIATLLVALMALAACSRAVSGPPRIEIDRTACAHCGMLVSERLYAAAYRAPGAEARIFDDIGCLLRALETEPSRDALALWVHDAPGREWIDGRDATFMHAATLPTPMGGGLLAYRDAADATRAAAEHNGTVVGSFDDLYRTHAGVTGGER